MTPLEQLIRYAQDHYSDDLSYDGADIVNKAKELLDYEKNYVSKQIELSYDFGYEVGLRQAVAKSYDA